MKNIPLVLQTNENMYQKYFYQENASESNAES
jgi:hypothetical protein